MKRSSGAHDPSPASISLTDCDDAAETNSFKDVFAPLGEALRFLEMEMAFRRAGYAIRKTEVSPHSPPVAVLHLLSKTAPRLSDDAQFAKHVRQILESVGIGVPKDDLVAEQNGNMALVAFIWQPLTPDCSEPEGLDELLALLP